MFILNDAAKNDPIIQMVIAAAAKRMKDEEEYREKVRAGLITPEPYTVWNISDRD